jgi:hypothetical protein
VLPIRWQARSEEKDNPEHTHANRDAIEHGDAGGHQSRNNWQKHAGQNH